MKILAPALRPGMAIVPNTSRAVAETITSVRKVNDGSHVRIAVNSGAVYVISANTYVWVI